MSETIAVVVDDRENRSGLVEAFRSRGDVAVTVRRLAVGDVLVDDEWAIERKTVEDFASSIKDGRLLKQVRRLVHSRWQPALVLEGGMRASQRLCVPRHAIQGAMVSISIVWRVPVLRSRDVEESAQVIVYAARQLRRVGRHEGRSVSEWNRLAPVTRQRIRFLMGLPGVGPQRAAALLHEFATVEDVLLADEEDLVRVPGISYGTARAIRKLVREARLAYNVAP